LKTPSIIIKRISDVEVEIEHINYGANIPARKIKIVDLPKSYVIKMLTMKLIGVSGYQVGTKTQPESWTIDEKSLRDY